jgi:hypothetical protein
LKVKLHARSVDFDGLMSPARTRARRPRPRRRGQVSARKRAANRRNARRSTGPRTAAGKARAARNARRHGLTLTLGSDPAWWRTLSAVIEAIAGPQADGARRERAMRVAHAHVEVLRIRKAKCDILADGVSPDTVNRLACLMRYERRAFARRKRAMRAFDGRAKENCQNEATGGISFNLSMGKGRSVARKSRRRSFVEIWMRDYARRHRSRRSRAVTKDRSFRRLRRVTG